MVVFSGKPDSAYTKLYLTHLDERGETTPPVVLDHLTSPDRAANIPEFVNVSPVAIRHIRERFIDDPSCVRAAWEFLKSNDYDGAERQARKALGSNPNNAEVPLYLAVSYADTGQTGKALTNLDRALQTAREAGDEQLIAQITAQIERCKRGPSLSPSRGR